MKKTFDELLVYENPNTGVNYNPHVPIPDWTPPPKQQKPIECSRF
jgi:hypothetical protein